MTAWRNDVDAVEHECPRPLESRVGEFAVGGTFFSPAGRWETITEVVPTERFSARVQLRTDRTGAGYCWQFWPSTKLPYLPAWRTSQPAAVRVFELVSVIEAEVTTARTACNGHTVVQAQRVRGHGWQVTDLVDGATVATVTAPSKARARSEVIRRARAHAKLLKLPLITGE